MGSRTQPQWPRQLAARWREHPWLKAIGIGVGITGFMFAYFALLEHPQFPVTVMPLQPFDHWIGFAPWAVIPYASLWLYIGTVPSLLHLRGEMGRYLLSVGLLGLIGCAAFFFFPTATPDFPIDWAQWPLVAMLKSADTSGNACPSLHVGFSVLTALWLHWLLRRVAAPRRLHVINALWCASIIWSTMATRQHVATDVETGAVLGACVAFACLHARPWRIGSRRARQIARIPGTLAAAPARRWGLERGQPDHGGRPPGTRTGR